MPVLGSARVPADKVYKKFTMLKLDNGVVEVVGGVCESPPRL